MLPIIKVLSLFIRVFARPIAAQTKKRHLVNASNGKSMGRGMFIFLGNWYNRQETKLNRKFMRIESKDDFFVKPLSDEMAIEKGVEFFYEIIIYSILFGFPCYEMYIQSVENQVKNEKLDKKMIDIDKNLDLLNTQFDDQMLILNEYKLKNEQLQNQIVMLTSLMYLDQINIKERVESLQTRLVEINSLSQRQAGDEGII